MLGKARLRTKTGCFQCRKQRRKCDERRPVCGNCERSRNDNIVCQWPTGKEAFLDGRHTAKKLSKNAAKERSAQPTTTAHNSEKYKSRLIVSVTDGFGDWNGYSEDSSSESCDSSVYDSAESSTASRIIALRPSARRNSSSQPRDEAPAITQLSGPFRSEQEAWLFTYAVNEFIPSIVHRASHKRYFNHSHTLSLAMHYPMLRDCLLACACSLVSSQNPDYRYLAMSYHTSAIKTIRESLSTRAVDGTEDFLLASVTLLTIFEGRRPDPSPSMLVSHVSAMGQLHKLRAAKRIKSHPTGQRMESDSYLVFERLHAESYLFHTSIMMLFDRVVDPQLDPEVWKAVSELIENNPFGPESSRDPVLGVPHPVFELVIQISRLRRKFLISGPDPSDSIGLIVINDKLNHWFQILEEQAALAKKENPEAPDSWDLDQQSGKMYIVAAKILVTLLQDQISESLSPGKIPASNYETKSDLLKLGLSVLATCDVDVPFCRHFIWPISVFALTSPDIEHLHLIFSKLKQIERRSNGGLAKWVLAKFQEGSFRETGSLWINPNDMPTEFDIRVQEIA